MRKKSLKTLVGEDLPRADCETVGIELSGKDEVKGREIMDAYFSSFVSPAVTSDKNGSAASGSNRCVKCNKRIDGIIGSFQWGLAHGEGHCCECGYPMRGHHYIKDQDGKDFISLTLYILQYHPTELKEAPCMEKAIASAEQG